MKNRRLWVSVLAGFLAFLLVLSVVLSLIPTPASAKSSAEIQTEIDELKAQQESLEEQIAQLQSRQAENQAETVSILQRKSNIDQQVSLLNAKISNLNAQITANTSLIADKQEELDAATVKQSELNAKYKERIRAMEEGGKLSYWSVLFKASSFSDFLDRLNMVQEIAASDQRRLEELRQAAQEVAEAREALTAEKESKEAMLADLEASQAELDTARAEAAEILAELVAKGAELEGLLEESEAQEDALIAEIGAAEQAYNEAKDAEWAAAHPPESSGGSGGYTYAPSEDFWIVPCSYVYVSGTYGWREAPTEGASTFHTGVDLAGPEGTPIYASRSGEVTRCGYTEYNGYYVGLNHGDGFSSVYLHMTTYVVGMGDYVSQGQLIGYMGQTGIATGPHLHFTIYYNGSTVNPAEYINIG